MKSANLDIIYKAAKPVRDKFDIDFAIAQCSRGIKTTTAADGVPIHLKHEPEPKIDSIVVKDHGGGPKKQSPNMRQTLRLAFILFDGIRYAMTGETKKAYTSKGWRPRVSAVRRQSYTK